MSLDKVLNRPLFRQGALKKGNLKPVRARIGMMMGAPTQNVTGQTARNFPLALNQQGFYGRNVRPFFQRLKADVRNFPSTAKSQLTDMRLKGRSVPFGMGGGLGGILGYEALYGGVSDLTTKLGMQPGMAKNIVDFGVTTAGSLTPVGRAIGLGLTGLKAARAVGSPVADYFLQKRGVKKGDTRKALTVDLGEPLFADAFRPRNPEDLAKEVYKKKDVDTRMNIASGRGAGSYPKIDELTQANNETVVGNDKVVDLNKVVQNTGIQTADSQGPQVTGDITGSIAPYIVDGGLTGPVGAEPGAPMGADLPSSKPPAPVKETPEQVAQKTFNASQDGKGTEQPIGGKRYTTNLIQRAKEIRAEMGMEPEGDTARSMFLSQLAAGLMAGTSKQRGLAGAVQIFGQALGPAVSNYGIMKLKQDELQNKSMETYLGFAFDEMKLFNDAAAGEPFGGELGIIQFINDQGQTVNVKGRQTKGGTMEFATGQVDRNGNEQYAAVSSQADVPGFGKVNQFLDKKTVNTATMKIGDTLSNRYKTFKIANDVLDTIAQKPKTVGPGGAINLFKTRFGSALNDLGFSFGGSKEDARGIAEAYRAQIEASDMDEKTKEELLDKMNFRKIYNNAVGRVQSRSGGEEITPEDLESLAVAETTLVYALANSFKDKDRLTARDVAAAEKLVNLFTLTRGSRSVQASIQAIGQQLQDDITRYENDYRRVGGLERTLQNMRVQNKFRTQSTDIADVFIKKLDEAGLLEEFDK